MFLHLHHPEQAKVIAEMIAFHAENREPETTITVSDSMVAEAFQGCVIFTTTTNTRGTGDRIVIHPDGSTLHIT